MAAKKKSELLAEASGLGVEVPEKATVPEIKDLLADAAPPAEAPAELPADAPDGDKALAALDAPEAPLPHTPTEALTEYAPLGEPQPDLEAPTDSVGEPVEVARGPLEGTPAESGVGGHAGRPEDGVPPIKTGA